ncbi:Conserved_hypothetical protein [Hexamita inflata]|uniref:Uncharacterized protein n=1 Tax=Hexamita inflata TaxID=28002 RepID=A0ABP1JI99_9EUKA
MVNGSCIQISCTISGQQSINGICQCVNINSIVQAGSCVCPVNSQVVGIACVCFIVGQTMQNGQCACLTTGAFVESNVCTCGVSSINMSNTCSCPIGAKLVNGVCTCININSYIVGDSCVCPTYSLLVENTCTCPSNSQIVNNICTCTIISDQVMNNGACQCLTMGAFVNNNNVCSCGINALNMSNTCICPIYSSLVNNVCTCDQIIGQQIINGSCLCPFGQSIINDSCKQINYTINISNLECSTALFFQSFDIESITNQVSAWYNFSAGYIFSTTTVIQNAFIDISDNVYQTTIYPLFQSQNSFTNLKIQFGTQQFLNSGSFILSSTTSLSVNQMNIISKSGSQLTVNNLLNILASSINANITNLLVNISFAPSNGNITLINNINSSFNVSGYQILGTYVTSGTVAMIGINIYSPTVNVNQVSLKPIAYNVGNGSSYLFGSSVSTSVIQINNFTVILGSFSNILLLGSISSSSLNYYIFGGIIAYNQGNSVIISVNNVIYDSYQRFSTDYIGYFGFLVGHNPIQSSSITIENVCLQQNTTSKTTTQYFQSGLIGRNQGNSSIYNTSVAFIFVQGADFYCIGIIGYQLNSSVYAEIINTISSVSVSAGEHVGSLFGAEYAQNCSVLNTSVAGGNIGSGSTSYQVGGLIGSQYQNTTITNSSVLQTNVSGSSYVGGFIGFQNPGQFYITNSMIQSARILGSSNIGIIIGYYISGTIYFIGSSSTQIYVNGVLRSNCAALSNRDGC